MFMGFRWTVRNLLERVGIVHYRDVDAAFAKLEPGHYILVYDKKVISPHDAAKIGFPRLGPADPRIRILKVGIIGDPHKDFALWRIEEDQICQYTATGKPEDICGKLRPCEVHG